MGESLPRRTYADLTAAYIAFARGNPTGAVDRIERLGVRLADGLRGETFGAVVVIPHVRNGRRTECRTGLRDHLHG